MTFIVFGFHKSGTTFLKNLIEYVSKKTKFRHLTYNKCIKSSNTSDSHTIICPVRYPSHLSKLDLNDEDQVFVQVRNPFDTLISEYYSFGYTHPPNGGKKEYDDIISVNVRRKDISMNNLDVDKYCLKYSDHLLRRYDALHEMLQNIDSKIQVLYYSDMIHDFDKYLSVFLGSLGLSHKYDEIYNKYNAQFSKFKPIEDKEIIKKKSKSHRRNGIPGEYKLKLKESTLKILEKKFEKYYKRETFYIE